KRSMRCVKHHQLMRVKPTKPHDKINVVRRDGLSVFHDRATTKMPKPASGTNTGLSQGLVRASRNPSLRSWLNAKPDGRWAAFHCAAISAVRVAPSKRE